VDHFSLFRRAFLLLQQISLLFFSVSIFLRAILALENASKAYTHGI